MPHQQSVMFANQSAQHATGSVLQWLFRATHLTGLVVSAGAYRGDEPTIGLDYYGRVFQMFRAAPVSDTCALTLLLVMG